jgi:hypothetical protein
MTRLTCEWFFWNGNLLVVGSGSTFHDGPQIHVAGFLFETNRTRLLWTILDFWIMLCNIFSRSLLGTPDMMTGG